MCELDNRTVQCDCHAMLGLNTPTNIVPDSRLAGVLKADLRCAECGKVYEVEYVLWGVWDAPVEKWGL